MAIKSAADIGHQDRYVKESHRPNISKKGPGSSASPDHQDGAAITPHCVHLRGENADAQYFCLTE